MSEEMEMPEGWAETPLKNILPIQYGKGLIEAHRDKNGHVPVYGSSGLVGFHNQPLTSKAALVIGRKGSVGSVYFSPVPCWPIDTTYFVEENDSVNLKFFLHLLLFLRLGQFDKSTAVPGLSRDDYNAITVKIAPLPEQSRIVAAIEQQFSRLDAGVAALKRAKVKLKRYRAAVLKAAVEGKLTETWRTEHPTTESASLLLERILKQRREKWEANLRAKGKDPAKVKYVEPAMPKVESLPKLTNEWCWATVEQLSNKVVDGTHHTPNYVEFGIPFISVKDIRDGYVFFDDCKYISEEEHNKLIQRCSPNHDDVLITKSGTIGRVALVKTDNPFSLFVSVALIKTCKNYLNQNYFKFALEYYILGINIQQDIKGGLIKNLHLEDLRIVPLRLPPLAEQEQIVAEVERHLSLISQLEVTVDANLKRAERLRQSILREAFAGRLVPQDPTDEPASVLLERIQNERNGQKNGTGVDDKKIRSVRVPEPVTLDAADAEQTELWESVGN